VTGIAIQRVGSMLQCPVTLSDLMQQFQLQQEHRKRSPFQCPLGSPLKHGQKYVPIQFISTQNLLIFLIYFGGHIFSLIVFQCWHSLW